MNYRAQQKLIVDQLRYTAPGQSGSVASIVPIRADYAADPAQALTSVVFVPPDLAGPIEQAIIAPLRAIEPEHHYYRPAAMHLTIKNVRRISHPPRFTPATVEAVHRLYRRIIPQQPAFSFSLEEVTPLATSVALIGYCDERLQTLVQALDAGLTGIGLPDDKQYVSKNVFFGNVTVCRYVHPPSARFFDAVTRLAYAFSGQLRVKDISLIACNAACMPESRTVWHTYTLRD